MATRADLNGIKEAIQNILIAANTTTASPIDLSSGLLNNKRVKKILKVNPEMIIPQASFFPLVTCYVDGKEMQRDDIAQNQLNVKRRATVDLKIVASVWNNNIVSVDEDPADEDINYLMENIELILRSDHTLNNTVNWQRPLDVKYYTSAINTQNHIRTGILSLQCNVFY